MVIDKYFEETRKVALCSEYDRVHIGCIAVYKGRIIAKGSNSEKTHPIQMHYNKYRTIRGINTQVLPKVHAEVKCLSKLKNMNVDFKKVKLFIYRIRCDQPYGLARPCPAYMMAIMDSGIRNIYYTTDTGYAHERILEG